MSNKIKFGEINKVKIDHTKIKTIDDVALIFKYMKVELVCVSENGAYQELKHLLCNDVTHMSDQEVDAMRDKI
ncbi:MULTISPECIES: hypothetical protein [unclassified Pedobacter]|uniref:hypothetical protein n=1 Tax=unclassified Pedobacter TaxID=2628915 RepID=UPI001422BEF9|nr:MULTISPECIES: hypothetical protein [unclassified Pedobacter]NII81717.1 hypothetical protein [Pedobacter sp. SG908]NMN35721.1 hypothetical protein [Pedobacter sp. SG918]